MSAWDVIKPIYYVTASTSLVILTANGVIAVIQFRKEPNICWRLKLLFYLSLLTAWTGATAFLVQNILDQEWGGTLTTLGVTMFLCFMHVLLATLVLRLHFTFRSSVYRMTMIQKAFFISILAVMSLLTVAVILNEVIPEFSIELPVVISYIAMYLIGSAVAVFLFIYNLRLLIKTRSSSEYKTDVTVDAIQLDEAQRKLGALAARYVLLFTVATLSTIFTWIGVVIWGIWMKPLIPLDWTINVICVYLQFNFVSHHYQRLCGFADKGCRVFVSNRARHSIRRATMESQTPKSKSTSPGLELSAVSSGSENAATPKSDQTS